MDRASYAGGQYNGSEFLIVPGKGTDVIVSWRLVLSG